MKTTDELLKNLKKSRTIDEYFKDNIAELEFESLPAMIERFISQKGLKKSDVVRDSGIENHYAYQIISGVKKPSRDKLVMICYGLHLTVEETQHVLKKCGHGELYPRSQRDSILIMGIIQKKSIMDINLILHGKKLDILD